MGAISLSSVGFASWVVINSPSFSNEAAINAAKVKEVDIFSKVTIDTFTLGEKGILDSEASITVTLIINNTYLSSFSYLDSNSKFTMTATLKPSKTSFVDYINPLSESGVFINGVSSSDGCEITNDGTITDSRKSTLSFVVNASVSATELTLKYEIVATNIEIFYQNPPKVTFIAEGIRQ